MGETLQVNRCLKNKAMDRIDHALGRPLDPLAQTYRNHYAAAGEIADELAASHLWTEGRCVPGGLRAFAVNDEGRQALAYYLAAIGDKHRAYTVTFDGYTHQVVATSHSKARYDYFLTISDLRSDLTFSDYCRRASARLSLPSPAGRVSQ